MERQQNLNEIKHFHDSIAGTYDAYKKQLEDVRTQLEEYIAQVTQEIQDNIEERKKNEAALIEHMSAVLTNLQEIIGCVIPELGVHNFK